MSVSSITSCLRNSQRGQLTYDRGPLSKEFLDNCSSPTQLSSFHQEYVQSPDIQHEQRKCCTRDFVPPFERSPIPTYSPTEIKTLEKDESPHSERKKPRSTIIVSPEFISSTLAVKNYQLDASNKARIAFEERRNLFKDAENRNSQKAEREYQQIQMKECNRALELQEKIHRQMDEGSVEMREKQRKMKEDHSKHAKMLEKRHEEIKKDIKKKEEEIKRRKEEMLKNLIKAKNMASDLKTVMEKVLSLSKPYQDKLQERVKTEIDQANQKVADSRQLVVYGEESGVSQETLTKLGENLQYLLGVHDLVKVSVDEIKAAELKKAQMVEKSTLQTQPQNAATVKTSQEEKPVSTFTQSQGAEGGAAGGSPSTSATGQNVQAKSTESLCFEEVFKTYNTSQKELKDTEKAIQVLSSTQELKKLKFDLQKVINTNINAISGISGEHLRDKLQRLLALLSGQAVEISNKRVSVMGHPEALRFCKFLLAKMIVKKGEEEVSAKHEAAYPLAAVAVAILCEHSDITPLLVAHFHTLCPYTVPFHLPRQEGQGTEEYHKSLGYKYDSDGNCEKQNMFLKRMSGVMRLYSAIMISIPPRGAGHPHPLGIEHAWVWLARAMNTQPLPDVTATVIYDLLQVTGHALYDRYKKQFLKLLVILFKEYLPKLRQVASSGGGGPVSRLEALINDSIRNQGHIAPPEGKLPNNFWFS